MEVSLTTLLEAFVIFVLLVLVFIFAAKLYQVFFGPDKQALRSFELVADNLNSAIQRSPSPDGTDRIAFRFTYKLWMKSGGNTLQGREDYKGTMWAVGTDGVISTQFPAWRDYTFGAAVTPPNYNTLGLTPQDIDKECVGKPCLCFSKETLKDDAPSEEAKAVLSNPYKCRSFNLPDGVTAVTFDFTQKASLEQETFPVVEIVKRTTGATVKIDMQLTRQGGTATT